LSVIDSEKERAVEDKSLMTKSGKPTPKKRKSNTAPLPLVSLEQQMLPSQKVFDAIPLAVISVDWKGQVQYMNRAAQSLLGEAESSLKLEEWPRRFGLYLDDGLIPYPVEKLPLVHALRGETVEEAEEIILRKEGDAKGIWISMSAETLRDENGNIDGAIALIRDVNYRKQIELSREKQVKRMEALYSFSRAVAEAGNDFNAIMNLIVTFTAEAIGDVSVIGLLNTAGDRVKIEAFHDTNPTGQALFRKLFQPGFAYDHTQTLGGSVIKSGEPLLIPLIQLEKLQNVTLPILKEYVEVIGMESILIIPLKGRSGVVGMISLTRHRGSKPFNTEDQSFLTDIAYRAVLAIENCRLFDSLHAEITERLSAKQALAVSEERFRSIFEFVTVGIKVLNLEGRILQTNYAFQSMIGYIEDELVGNYFHKFLHPDDVRRAMNLFDDVKTNGATSFRFEHRALHKDQSLVWVKTIFTVIRKDNEDQTPAFVVGIVENVTEQKRIEAEMAELNSRLQSSMELERLRLAQELHDSPMQSLYSAIYRIEELRNAASPELKEALTDVKEHIQEVLQDLRATAKELRPPTIFNFGLENAIRSHAGDVVEKHPNLNIHLSLAHDRQMLPEKVRLALFRIFQQSLANVIRHAKATEVHVRFSFDAEEAYLEITDNGKGFEVPANWIELVRRGHYGLAGAAERANALGGMLKVQSKPGISTTIQVIVPWKDSMDEN
jgi:PAS domain S-box-containing protein